MAEESSEQDKSESASPYKLDRARRRGMVARGTDLGFLSALVALAIIAQLSGAKLVASLAQLLRRDFVGSIAMASSPGWISSVSGQDARAVALALVLPAFLLVAISVAVEIVQNRGVLFSAEPFKPDFSRINPAKGLKRFFSLRILKELAKNLVKFGLYGGGAYLFISGVTRDAGLRARDGRQLAGVLSEEAGRLLTLFIVLAAGIALLDQILARREFSKQMRMSRRDVTREHREREGEPRQKQKRKQIMAEIIKQAGAAANVKGSDMLIVNPTHFAIALRYRKQEGDAPIIQARGRNLWALRMRRTAEREGIAIVHNPTLARTLYREGQVGGTIGQSQFVAVADIYIMLRRTQQIREDA